MPTFKKFDYGHPIEDAFDEQMRGICDALNSLPGIETSQSCCGHGTRPAQVWFTVSQPEGLSFLVRCMDRRYFKYGSRMRLDLTISDSPPTRVIYCLETTGRYWTANGTTYVGQEAYDMLDALVENMVQHLNHEAYIEHFDLGTFSIVR